MIKVKDIDIELQHTDAQYSGSLDTQGIFANATHLIGFGFDGTACFRKGTKHGPDALRAVSDDIETYSPYLDEDISDVTFYDLGNLKVEPADGINRDALSEHDLIEASWQRATDDYCSLMSGIDLEKHQVKTLVLGGEHSISYGPIKTYLAQYPNLVLLHLDAHADLRDGYLGFHQSHASIIRRSLDHFGPDHQLIQYGIRSGTRDEYKWMRENGTLKTSRQEFLDAVAAIPEDRPIYLTFDLDFFDPSYFPGTGTPEPGGEDFHAFVSLCKLLKNKKFVGCDVVELSPEIDPTGNSDVFAAKVVRELVLCLRERD